MIINTDYRISPYFFFIQLSFALSYCLIFVYSKSREINKAHLRYSMLLHYVLSMYCGFMFTFVTNLLTGKSVLSKVGLSGMGGMIGTIFSIFVMCFLFKEQKSHFVRCYVMSLPLIYGISKMGCFLVGCCYGMPYAGPFCVSYIKQGIMTPDHSVFPVQLTECIGFVILAVIFFYLVCHKNIKNIVEFEIISCCVLKFLLDYLRDRPDMSLSLNQKACVFVVALVTCFIFTTRTICK